MPELRRDPVTGEWVVVATERARRPSDFAGHSPGQHSDEGETCPFCPGNESLTPPEIMAFRQPGSQRNGPGWWVRVVPNKFPALAIEGDLNKTGFGMYDWMNGVGAHEIIIETPEHSKQLPFLDTRQVEDLLWGYRARYLDLKKDPRLKHILIFRNYGRIAGASLSHPHSQLVATPIVPGQVAAELEATLRWFLRRVGMILQAEKAALMLYEPETGELVAQWPALGLTEEEVGIFRVRATQGISGQVFREGRPIITDDATSDPRTVKENVALLSVRNVLTVPLVIERKDAEGMVVEKNNIGVFHVFNKRNNGRFAEEDITLLTALAKSAASVISSAKLYIAVADEKRELERTLQGMLAGVLVVGADSRVRLMNSAARHMFPLSRASSAPCWTTPMATTTATLRWSSITSSTQSATVSCALSATCSTSPALSPDAPSTSS